jgi:biotin-dependent carboxylase-like uncharacterized protein
MAIKVLAPGILTSVQDGGRKGFQQYGVSPSGPMDLRAFRTANILAGNDPDEAGLEMTLMGGEYQFLSPHVIALTGADMKPVINGKKADMYRALSVNSGDILRLGFASAGCRCYLAVHGGIDVKPVMGSRSTMVGKQFGGYEGRKLQKDDLLKVRDSGSALPHPETWFADAEQIPSGVRTLRVIMGPQEDRFTEQGIRTFLGSEYTVGQDFDRQGYRLEGNKIEHKTDSNIISDGVVAGSIQVPGTGLPILMAAEHATVGGYTKIATVITADLPLIGQCRAGDRIRFEKVAVEEAQELLVQEVQRLEDLMKQVRDPSHLPAAAEAERPVPEYEYTKDIILTIRGKAYDVRIQKIKDSESY